MLINCEGDPLQLFSWQDKLSGSPHCAGSSERGGEQHCRTDAIIAGGGTRNRFAQRFAPLSPFST